MRTNYPYAGFRSHAKNEHAAQQHCLVFGSYSSRTNERTTIQRNYHCSSVKVLLQTLQCLIQNQAVDPNTITVEIEGTSLLLRDFLIIGYDDRKRVLEGLAAHAQANGAQMTKSKRPYLALIQPSSDRESWKHFEQKKHMVIPGNDHPATDSFAYRAIRDRMVHPHDRMNPRIGFSPDILPLTGLIVVGYASASFQKVSTREVLEGTQWNCMPLNWHVESVDHFDRSEGHVALIESLKAYSIQPSNRKPAGNGQQLSLI